MTSWAAEDVTDAPADIDDELEDEVELDEGPDADDEVEDVPDSDPADTAAPS